jgi:hypothetical protein
MKIIAIIYLILLFLELLLIPFFFGKSRPDYSPKLWIITVILYTPLIYILIKIL